jgi:hypothetical protein
MPSGYRGERANREQIQRRRTNNRRLLRRRRGRAAHPPGLSLDWVEIVATTTVGTTMAAFCDRSLGIGYVGGSALLSTLLMPVWACNGCEMPQDGQYPS